MRCIPFASFCPKAIKGLSSWLWIAERAKGCSSNGAAEGGSFFGAGLGAICQVAEQLFRQGMRTTFADIGAKGANLISWDGLAQQIIPLHIPSLWVFRDTPLQRDDGHFTGEPMPILGGSRFVAWGPGSFLAIVPDIPPEIWITGARTDEKRKF